MNRDIKDCAAWASSQGWRVYDDKSGYTRFHNPDGAYITCYPATPSKPHRRKIDLIVNLKKAGLPWPPPSKKEQRSQRRKDQT